jgi:hypothetical protein
MAYVLTRTLKLDDISNDWKGCYITMREPTVEETQMLSTVGTDKTSLDMTLELMGKLFISGKGYDGKGIIDIKGSDIDQLPVSVLGRIVDFLLENIQSGKNTEKL